jgi:iron-sulfur cluster insertion protein
MNNTITITNAARDKITNIIASENDDTLKLRAFIQGGGCSGFSYGFTLDDSTNDDDYIINEAGITILVDSMSMQYLQDSVIDYKDSITSSSFVITNPNAVSTCGCGSSFSIKA